MIDFAKLKAPFPPDQIEWRVGSTNQEKTKGLPLAYIDARTVMQRLDDVVGPENWQCRYSHAGAKTVCDIGILWEYGNGQTEWIWKANGAGDTDFEAEKGALSDAFKRAAVVWGIGRYLYDVKAPWVAITARGKSYVIAESEMPRLNALLTGKKTPEKKEQSDIEKRFDNFWRALSTATADRLETVIRNGALITSDLAKQDPEKHAKLLAFIDKRREELKNG